MPNSIVESFFAGKPVVASEVGEVRNMMTLDGEIVGAVTPLVDWAVDLDAAALVVAKFASDPSEYQRVNSLVPGLAQRFAIDRYSRRSLRGGTQKGDATLTGFFIRRRNCSPGV